MVHTEFVSMGFLEAPPKPPQPVQQPKPCTKRPEWRYLSYSEKRKLGPIITNHVREHGVSRTHQAISCEGLQTPHGTISLSMALQTVQNVAERYGWKPRYRR